MFRGCGVLGRAEQHGAKFRERLSCQILGNLKLHLNPGMFKLLSTIDTRTASLPELPTDPHEVVFIDSMWADPQERLGRFWKWC